MPWFIYSPEELPNTAMMGKPRYTPDSEYIRWNSLTLRVYDTNRNETSIIPKERWAEVVEMQTTKRRTDWRTVPYEVDVFAAKFKPVVESRFGERGVIMLNHEPTDMERKHLETAAFNANMTFRKHAIEFYEQQRKSAEGRQGTYEPTPYIDECYELLNMRKPYSMEALRAQRDPGREAAIDIANAMKNAQKETAEMVANTIADVLTRPKDQTQGSSVVPARK